MKNLCNLLSGFTFGLMLSSLAHSHPPKEAFVACENSAENAVCEFNGKRGLVIGKCDSPKREKKLVCVPDNHNSKLSHKTLSGKLSHKVPARREHQVIQTEYPGDLRTATQLPVADSYVETRERDQIRIIYSNGIADHATGSFPNPGNPHQIEAQNYKYSLSSKPAQNLHSTDARGMVFGVAVNGVPFDPGAAEWYQGNPQSGWNYNALAGAIPLGLDENHAHVQPGGAYHYHGLPMGLLDSLNLNQESHSPILGWAADGFPIYALYGFDSSSRVVAEMRSGYQLKSGNRPVGSGQPGGYYDGTFVEDYEYNPLQADLDECNGRFTRTPEFPNGTYAYFLTRSFPVVPRCFMGTPSKSFYKRRA